MLGPSLQRRHGSSDERGAARRHTKKKSTSTTNKVLILHCPSLDDDPSSSNHMNSLESIHYKNAEYPKVREIRRMEAANPPIELYRLLKKNVGPVYLIPDIS